jgi:peptide/nickel transport system permease protein
MSASGGLVEAPTTRQRAGTLVRVGRSLWRSKLALLSVLVILTLVGVAVFGEAVAPHSPHQQHLRFRFLPPAFLDGGTMNFVFGTDGLGRDILSRLIVGARISLFVGFSSVVLGGLIGVTLGIMAGYFGGWIDLAIMRLVDLQMAFPTMFIGLFAMALLGTGLVELIIVIAIVQWAYYARVARAEALRIKEMEYFHAARALGVGTWRIMARHVLPNAVGPILVVASFSFSTAIFYESALSFFGVGVPPNIPTWGNMLADARNVLLLTFWYPVFPGLAITVTVLAFNLLGDWMRDYFDVTLDD